MTPDEIALDNVSKMSSPADIADWPRTVAITGIVMDPAGGLSLSFDRSLPDSWKWPSAPPPSTDNIQFTVWAVVNVGGRWFAAGFVQMWQGRPMGDGSLPPILTGYVNWWGDVRRLWGEMSDYVPLVNDLVGFFVSAGNARLTSGVTSVRERSNVVAVKLPIGDAGSFTFGEAPPLPAPDWMNQFLDDMDSIVVELHDQNNLLTAMNQRLGEIAAQRFTDLTASSNRLAATLESMAKTGVKVHL